MSIVILAIILIGAAPFFYIGHSLVHRGKIKREAILVARDRLESLASSSFDHLMPGPPAVSTVQLQDDTAVMTTNIEDVLIDVDGDGYRHVTVTLQWSLEGKPDQVVLETYITDVGGSL